MLDLRSSVRLISADIGILRLQMSLKVIHYLPPTVEELKSSFWTLQRNLRRTTYLFRGEKCLDSSYSKQLIFLWKMTVCKITSCSVSLRKYCRDYYDSRQCRSSPDLLTDVSKQVQTQYFEAGSCYLYFHYMLW